VRVKKDYEWTFKNGILEVKFKRKWQIKKNKNIFWK
jgi:HSP20 family molecular chaperone IbpA